MKKKKQGRCAEEYLILFGDGGCGDGGYLLQDALTVTTLTTFQI